MCGARPEPTLVEPNGGALEVVVMVGVVVRMVVRLQKSNSSSTRAVRDEGGREGPPRQATS